MSSVKAKQRACTSVLEQSRVCITNVRSFSILLQHHSNPGSGSKEHPFLVNKLGTIAAVHGLDGVYRVRIGLRD
jgi:hypothetical protein